jgi:hypothetical protein
MKSPDAIGLENIGKSYKGRRPMPRLATGRPLAVAIATDHVKQPGRSLSRGRHLPRLHLGCPGRLTSRGFRLTIVLVT